MNTLRVFKARSLLALVISIVLAISLTGSASATLTGSIVESGDGDLDPNTSDPPRAFDWNHPYQPISCPGTNCGLDPVGSEQDDILNVGTREDDTIPTIIHSSVPPNRDDLSRFYAIQEIEVGGFLHLAWERANLLGAAHLDFEFNQSNMPSANGVTPLRTEGDVLLSFDFGGTGAPIVSRHSWMTSGDPAKVCGVSTSLPCWSKGVRPASSVEANVNHTPVVDMNPPDAPFTLPADTNKGIRSTFGELGIDLAMVVPTDRCLTFSSIWLKSRSGGWFNAPLIDFIAPVSIDIPNCGFVTVEKSDQLGTPLAGASFSLYIDNPPVYPSARGPEDVATNLSCISDDEGFCYITQVPLGKYWLVETQAPPGYLLGSGSLPVWIDFNEIGLGRYVRFINAPE